MSKLRILAVVVGLLLLIPMIVISVQGADPKAAAEGDTPSSTVDDASVAAASETDAQALTQQVLTTEHRVLVTQILAPEDLLQDGEAMPKDIFLDLYAAARAPARLISHCAEVIETIGISCDLVHSAGHTDPSGKIVLNGHLRFVPAAADNGATAGQTPVTASIDLPFQGNLRPANDAASRSAALTEAQALCDALRGTFGNCALTEVRFDIEELWITDLEILPAGTNPQRLRISATYQIHATPGTLDQEKLLDQLHEMTGQS